jgi:hypothetical protein
MDGHNSHYTIELLEYAQANNIIILGYPPHCTHILQGLDVVCFMKMKNEFWYKIQQFEDLQKRYVRKADFAGVFGHAYLHAFTKDTIKAAFTATGVYPFYPGVITEKQLQLSLPTSTKGTFPILQPSPMHAIISAMGSHPPTTFELSPTTHSTPAASLSHQTHPTPSPRLRHPYKSEIGPELETPTKQTCIMYGALALTSTGSLLMSKTRTMFTYTISAPVLEAVDMYPISLYTKTQLISHFTDLSNIRFIIIDLSKCI